MTHAVTNFRLLGDAIVRRLGLTVPKDPDAVTVPAALEPYVTAFDETHKSYAAACDAADKGREQRDDALEAVGQHDEALDGKILQLANALVGAGLGDRRNPFAEFSKFSPALLCRQPYANMPELVRDLVKNVLAKKPPADVAKLTAECQTLADALESGLLALTVPQALFTGAMKTRDEQLPQWHKAFKTLKIQAAAAWHEAPGTLAMVFAPPPVVTVPRRRRARKAAKGAGTPPETK